MVGLKKIFDSFIKDSLFKDKSVLQTSYIPAKIPHRNAEIEQIASILAPSLRGERTSNLFVYGQTGTGKTLSINYVKDELLRRAKSIGVNLKIIYLNCKLRKVSDTEYRILAEIIRKLGGEVPSTGLPTHQVYNKFTEMIDEDKQILILILEEVDQAVYKSSDTRLYNLTRLNLELKNTTISLVGISNDLKFLDSLDPRVKSSLSEEEITFHSYNALQLQEILKERASRAFKEGVLEEGVIAKCAAYAAKEHGDARRALDLLRVAGELAEREQKKKIGFQHIDLANRKIDRDKILDIVQSGPKHFQLALLSVLKLAYVDRLEKFFTGDIYNVYQEFCEKTKTEILTQRRMSDLIAELDMLGLINARVISKGRHGRTREIKLAIQSKIIGKVQEILEESLGV